MKRNSSFHLGFTLMLSVLLGGILLVGCGGSSGGSSGSSSSGGSSASGATSCGNPPKLTKSTGLKVGFSQNISNSPWRLAENKSMQDGAKAAGDTFVMTDAGGQDSKQVSDIQSLISQKVDVLIIAPLTETGEVSAILAAKKACIPVFLVDRDADHSLAKPGQDYVTFVGSDFVKQAQLVADTLIKATNGKGKIIELEGTSGATPAILRKQGFDNEIKKYPGMQIVASQDANFDRDTARQKMQTLLQAHPDVTIVYAANDEMAQGAIAALKAAGKTPGKDVIIGSIDGETAALQSIIAGQQLVSVTSNPRLGSLAYQAISDYAGGKTVPAWVVMQDQTYTKDNAQANLANGF
ncbi:MAG TPA: ABC transporter substrate-binding protein [Ktedonobacteraceae bacterium]|nr:ABC transporter substrate-binding protein [Ktedonobacteraceae bacterium]